MELLLCAELKVRGYELVYGAVAVIATLLAIAICIIYIKKTNYKYESSHIPIGDKIHLADKIIRHTIMGRTAIEKDSCKIGIVFQDKDTNAIETYYYHFELRKNDTAEEVLDLENMVYYYW